MQSVVLQRHVLLKLWVAFDLSEFQWAGTSESLDPLKWSDEEVR